jgi:hypothetical protein
MIKPVLREANKYANCFANFGCEQTITLVVYDNPPTFLVQFSKFDVLAIDTPRLVSLYFHVLGLRLPLFKTKF